MADVGQNHNGGRQRLRHKWKHRIDGPDKSHLIEFRRDLDTTIIPFSSRLRDPGGSYSKVKIFQYKTVGGTPWNLPVSDISEIFSDNHDYSSVRNLVLEDLSLIGTNQDFQNAARKIGLSFSSLVMLVVKLDSVPDEFDLPEFLQNSRPFSLHITVPPNKLASLLQANWLCDCYHLVIGNLLSKEQAEMLFPSTNSDGKAADFCGASTINTLSLNLIVQQEAATSLASHLVTILVSFTGLETLQIAGEFNEHLVAEILKLLLEKQNEATIRRCRNIRKLRMIFPTIHSSEESLRNAYNDVPAAHCANNISS